MISFARDIDSNARAFDPARKLVTRHRDDVPRVSPLFAGN